MRVRHTPQPGAALWERLTPPVRAAPQSGNVVSGGTAMLSPEDNEALTRVGPGTLMGNLMRQYWLPALLSSELAAPDCPPLRLRLLGEDLIAFRVTSGAVGIVRN